MPENLALYAVAGVAATEATGITNFTEIGGAGNDPEDNPFEGIGPPSMPPGLGEAFGSLSAALAQTTANAGRGGFDTSGLANIIAGQQQQIATLTEGLNSGGGYGSNPREIIEWAWENTPKPNGGGGGGGGGLNYEDLGINVGFGGGGSGGGSEGPRMWDSAGSVALNFGTWADQQTEAFPTVLGFNSFREGEGLLGRSYRGGQITGSALNQAGDYWAGLDRQYREAVSGPRSAVQSAKTATRPWEWDISTIPGGTAAAASPDSEGSTDQSPGVIQEVEVSSDPRTGITSGSGEIASGASPAVDVRSGVDTGITSGSGDTATGVISLPESMKRKEKREEPRNTGGLVQ